MKAIFTFLLLTATAFVSLMASAQPKGKLGSIPLKSGNGPLYGTDVYLHNNPSHDQRQAGLSVAFNGWLYACYSLGYGGFIVVKSTDNGVTWDGWENTEWSGYYFPKLDIVVTGNTVDSLQVWVAYTCLDTSDSTSWFIGYENFDGNLNYIGTTDLDTFTSDIGYYDVAIASDYRNPAVGSNPYSLGILVSKWSSPYDSLLFFTSGDGGQTFNARVTVTTSGSYLGGVSLSYGKCQAYPKGRYFAAWEERDNQSASDCSIYTSHTISTFASDFVHGVRLDSIGGGAILGLVKNPSISTQFSEDDNDQNDLTAVVLFDLDQNGNGETFGISGMYNKKTLSGGSWNQLTVSNSTDDCIQPDISFDPGYGNFLVTYFDSTTQKLFYVYEGLNLPSVNQWTVESSGYNDQANLVAPWPKVRINPAQEEVAHVWVGEWPSGKGAAMFDAEYSNYVGVSENHQSDLASLYGAFPDPCSTYTSIGFSLAVKTRVTLSMYSEYGKQLGVLMNQVCVPGKYDVRADMSGFPAGCYLYRFQAGDFTASGKIIVVKQ